MATLVLTVVGDDRSDLVDALSHAIAGHGGNWEKSHVSRLEGKLAGILMVTVAEENARGLIDALDSLETRGLLEVVVEESEPAAPPSDSVHLSLEIVGRDHPGIISKVSHALAERAVVLEELVTETTSAPMAGETLFKASASLQVPVGTSIDELVERLEALAHELVVDIEIAKNGTG